MRSILFQAFVQAQGDALPDGRLGSVHAADRHELSVRRSDGFSAAESAGSSARHVDRQMN